MQRGGGTNPVRTALIVCLVIIALLTLLYFMKRIEANRITGELKAYKLDCKELEEDMNTQLSEHLQKIESLTQEVSQLQSRLTKCEDDKASKVTEFGKLKQSADSCVLDLQEMQHEKDDLQQQLTDLNGMHEDAANNLGDAQRELDSLKDTLAIAEEERDSCGSQLTQMQGRVEDSTTHLTSCQAELEVCKKQSSSIPAGRSTGLKDQAAKLAILKEKLPIKEASQFEPAKRVTDEEQPDLFDNAEDEQLNLE